MSRPLTSALARAAEAQWALRFGHRPGLRIAPVVLPRPEQVAIGIARRPASVVPLTLQPVTVLRPSPETDEQIAEFVRAEFAEAARKREGR